MYHENIEQTEEQGSVSGRDDRLVYVIPKEIVSGDIGVTVYFGKGMVSKMNAKESILNGKAALGIEFGSTRIKAVLIDENCEALAVGSYHWENQLVDGIWTYSLEMIHTGLQACYKDLADKVRAQYDLPLTKLAGIGISAMMHGYMAFNKEDELLVPFRTWRNTMTEEAAAKLTEEFQVNVPERYSISHLYQAILKNEEHVKDITFSQRLPVISTGSSPDRRYLASVMRPVCSQSIVRRRIMTRRSLRSLISSSRDIISRGHCVRSCQSH